MSDPTIIAASIVTVIAALTTGIVTVVNAVAAARDRRRGRDERAALAETTSSTDRKADTIIEQGAAIHTATNGTLSKVQAKLDATTALLAVATEKLHALETLIVTLTATRGRRRTTDPQEPPP